MFATPLGLLALLAIPAIVAIHLFRRRFPVRPVAGLFLWQIVRQTPEGGGKIARLPITTSLILECLAALALALILAGARAVVGRRQPASRRAARRLRVDGRGQRARRERARPGGAARARRDRSSWRRARVTLVRSGDRPSVLAGPAAFAVEARPRAGRHGSRTRRIIRSRSAFGWRASSPAEPAG